MPAESVQFVVDDFLLVRELVRDGVGVGLLPVLVAAVAVREGLAEEVALEGVPPTEGELVMLYPASGPPPKKVTVFRDFLVEALSDTRA